MKQNWCTTKLERFTYAIYFAGLLLFNVVVGSFVLVYLLNAGISEVVAGSILLLPKIWDAINDTLFGVTIDKVRFRKGRFLPWIRIAAFGLPLATVFLFSMPAALSETGKIIWVIVGYILWDTFYTMCDLPINALITSITNNLNERNSMLSVTRITGGLGGMIAAIIPPLLYGENGANLGWSVTAVIIGVIGFLCMAPAGFVVKERFHSEKESEPTFRELFSGLMNNRNLLIIIAVQFLFSVTFTVQVLNSVFCQYVLGNETIAAMLTMCISLPVLLLAAFIPALTRKFDKVHLYAFFMILFILASVVEYFIGYDNMTTLLIITVIRGLGNGGVSTLSYMFIPDCVEYGQYINGQRNEGVSYAVQSFFSKLSGTLISTVGAFMIAALGFDATNVTEQGKHGVWFTITLFAAIGSVFAVILLKTYSLRDKDVAVIINHNNGQMDREECDRLLKSHNSKVIHHEHVGK